jgi:hypothetical protein
MRFGSLEEKEMINKLDKISYDDDDLGSQSVDKSEKKIKRFKNNSEYKSVKSNLLKNLQRNQNPTEEDI